MPKHLTAKAIAKRRTCPMGGVSGPHEVIVIESWGDKPEFEIPRMCLEFLGIDVGDPKERAYWFRKDEAEKARTHMQQDHERAA